MVRRKGKVHATYMKIFLELFWVGLKTTVVYAFWIIVVMAGILGALVLGNLIYAYLFWPAVVTLIVASMTFIGALVKLSEKDNE